MKKIKLFAVAFALALVFPYVLSADMAFYVNGGVSNINPTIGINAEFQYGYASVALGAGIMALNNFGLAVGARGYLQGIDGGPYFELIYGSTGEKANTHLDTYGKEVVDSVEVLQGVSSLLGWRFFFGDGWNMTLGAGASTLFPKQGDISKTLVKPVLNVTAGVMFWGDEAAEKNAEKYAKSYRPPEPGSNTGAQDMPAAEEIREEDIPMPDMLAEGENVTPTADAVIEPEPETFAEPAAVTATAPAAVTVTAPAAVTEGAGTK